MKLNKEEFEKYAKEQGLEDGAEAFEVLGLDREEYEEYINGKKIGRRLLLKMYENFGVDETINCIDFESYDWEKNVDLFDYI